MRIPVMNLDSIGIIEDVRPHDLPMNAWSSGKNVRFKDRRVEKIGGYQKAFTPLIDAVFALPARLGVSSEVWVHCSNTAINAQYSVNGSVGNVTRLSGPYTEPVYPSSMGTQIWTGGNLNGVMILNNPHNVPQSWVPQVGGQFANLANWPAGWSAISLRPFKNYLVGLGVSATAAYFEPHKVNWSHPADPGTVPISWDVADATRDAGTVTLADNDSWFVDQAALRGANILYKTDKAYSMRHVGGNDIFRFDPILGDGYGLMCCNAVQRFAYKGEYHFVVGVHDVYVHDGQTVTSVLQGKNRDWFYKNIDPTYHRQTFVVHHIAAQEMYICFPTTGNLLPNMALVWNYVNNSTTMKELPGVGYGLSGKMTTLNDTSQTDTWDFAFGTIDSDIQPWGFAQREAAQHQFVSFTHGATRAAHVHDTNSAFVDSPFTSTIERIGLAILGKDMNGQPIFDSDTIKIVTEVWPRFRAEVGTVIDVHVGTQSDIAQPVSWNGPYPFVIGRDEKVTPYCSGKIISIRFSNTSSSHWDCAGYDLEIVSGGKY